MDVGLETPFFCQDRSCLTTWYRFGRAKLEEQPLTTYHHVWRVEAGYVHILFRFDDGVVLRLVKVSGVSSAQLIGYAANFRDRRCYFPARGAGKAPTINLVQYLRSVK